MNGLHDHAGSHVLILMVSLALWGAASMHKAATTNATNDAGRPAQNGQVSPTGIVPLPGGGTVQDRVKEAAVQYAKQKAKEFLRKRMTGR